MSVKKWKSLLQNELFLQTYYVAIRACGVPVSSEWVKNFAPADVKVLWAGQPPGEQVRE